MAAKKSAGVLVYRTLNNTIEVLLVHPGGPFWKKKDIGAWSIPKGEFTDEEEPLAAAKREFEEETGLTVDGTFKILSPLKQNSGKVVYAWAVEADLDVTTIKSNEFEFEWPPKSGKMIMIPEVDKAEWMDIATAKQKIISGQLGFIDELLNMQ